MRLNNISELSNKHIGKKVILSGTVIKYPEENYVKIKDKSSLYMKNSIKVNRENTNQTYPIGEIITVSGIINTELYTVGNQQKARFVLSVSENDIFQDTLF